MKYQLGQKVQYRPSFGTGEPEIVTIIGHGGKNGQTVYDYDNGCWSYESAIDFVVEDSACEVIQLAK